MNTDGHTIIWMVLAGLAAWLSLTGLASGGAPLLPLVVMAVALTCAVHAGSRNFVLRKLGDVFDGGTVRTLLILGAAMAMWQLLPLEMALFAAGEALAYLELLAAVGLVAAQARLTPVRRWAGRLKGRAGAVLIARRRDVSRAVRAVRVGRRWPPSDADGEPWPAAYAMA
jgi:hypothetical protein